MSRPHSPQVPHKRCRPRSLRKPTCPTNLSLLRSRNRRNAAPRDPPKTPRGDPWNVPWECPLFSEMSVLPGNAAATLRPMQRSGSVLGSGFWSGSRFWMDPGFWAGSALWVLGGFSNRALERKRHANDCQCLTMHTANAYDAYAARHAEASWYSQCIRCLHLFSDAFCWRARCTCRSQQHTWSWTRARTISTASLPRTRSTRTAIPELIMGG